MAAPATGPGLDCPGNLFLGSGTADSVVIGAERALVIDNTAEPPIVSVAGATFGEFSSLFGNGVAGDVTIDENSVLNEDLYAENLVIEEETDLDPNGFRIFVRGTLTINGAIRSVGNPGEGANGGVGTLDPQEGTIGGGQAGHAGGAFAANGANGVPLTHSLGGQGGSGGGNGVQTGGTAAAVGIEVNEGGLAIANSAISMILGRSLAGHLIEGGGGGASGCGATLGGSGGGGGAGGRNIMVAAARVIFGPDGVIESRGGDGADGGDSTGVDSRGAGGGGGGGGGLVALIYKNISAGFDENVRLRSTPGEGGAGSAGTGTGAAGNPGADGEPGVTIAIRV